jgi:N-acetylglucosaminyldiphosphoundecaprenol N-acetyl-beta-D-mannosaminyltransferase
MQKLFFSKEDPLKLINLKKKVIFNFLNAESLWHYKNTSPYNKLILNKNNINFPDGKYIGLKLKLSQKRGPSFTRNFLLSSPAKSKKHFIIGNCTQKELSTVASIPLKNIKVYSPPYIKQSVFSDAEKNKIVFLLNLFKPDYVWVGIGAPKQEILSNQLYLKYACNYINIGAAIDFLTNKKSEAPSIFIKLKLEWFYRLVTDFKRSKKKVYRSIVGLRYLKYISAK